MRGADWAGEGTDLQPDKGGLEAPLQLLSRRTRQPTQPNGAPYDGADAPAAASGCQRDTHPPWTYRHAPTSAATRGKVAAYHGSDVINPQAFGGFKEGGIGRGHGFEEIYEYTELQIVA